VNTLGTRNSTHSTDERSAAKPDTSRCQGEDGRGNPGRQSPRTNCSHGHPHRTAAASEILRRALLRCGIAEALPRRRGATTHGCCCRDSFAQHTTAGAARHPATLRPGAVRRVRVSMPRLRCRRSRLLRHGPKPLLACSCRPSAVERRCLLFRMAADTRATAGTFRCVPSCQARGQAGGRACSSGSPGRK
jgi:hypothetical protein